MKTYFSKPVTQENAYWDDEDWDSNELHTMTVHDVDGNSYPTGLFDAQGQELWCGNDFKMGFDLTVRSNVMATKKKNMPKGKSGKGCK